MGFLEGLGRMIAGQPVFTADNQQGSQDGQSRNDSTAKAPVTADDPFVKNGYKVIPEVVVTHIKPHLDGQNLDVWADIENLSDMAVFVDKLHFLGKTLEIDRELGPHQSHQVRIYHGSTLTQKPQDKADLEYRIQANGDYFRAQFWVEFHMEGQNYLPEEFHSNNGIRDI